MRQSCFEYHTRDREIPDELYTNLDDWAKTLIFQETTWNSWCQHSNTRPASRKWDLNPENQKQTTEPDITISSYSSKDC
jgi:hypothetical protein